MLLEEPVRLSWSLQRTLLWGMMVSIGCCNVLKSLGLGAMTTVIPQWVPLKTNRHSTCGRTQRLHTTCRR